MSPTWFLLSRLSKRIFVRIPHCSQHCYVGYPDTSHPAFLIGYCVDWLSPLLFTYSFCRSCGCSRFCYFIFQQNTIRIAHLMTSLLNAHSYVTEIWMKITFFWAWMYLWIPVSCCSVEPLSKVTVPHKNAPPPRRLNGLRLCQDIVAKNIFGSSGNRPPITRPPNP